MNNRHFSVLTFYCARGNCRACKMIRPRINIHVPRAKPSAKSGHRTEHAVVVIGGQGYLVYRCLCYCVALVSIRL